MKDMKKIVSQQFYSGEGFDRLTALALQIADDARANGRTEPAYGYSRGDWIEAEERLSHRVNSILSEV
jgi:hypothetical protein